MSDMFGIISCTSCGRKRIINTAVEKTRCPYCGRTDAKDKLTILFSDRDHNTVREALLRSDSHKYAELERKKGADPDPLSTLVYDYEHTSGTVQKLMVVAEGLTKIKDTFTEEDVEDLFPGKGEQMLRNMISADLIIEIGYGRYRAI